jgi:hypothetical protein
MRRQTTVSRDDAVIHLIRKGREFAAEHLKAALEDADEPRVLLNWISFALAPAICHHSHG